MGRSIYCSKCKLEKEDAVKNESYCKSCKSERMKMAKIKKRLALGLPATRPIRKAFCFECISKRNLGEDITGKCVECHRLAQAERVKNARLAKGLPGVSLRSTSHCLKCGLEKINGRCMPCNNKVKNANKAAKKKKLREEEGKRAWGTRAQSPCIVCGSIKEYPEKSYCNSCVNAKAREKWRESNAIKFNKREITLVCQCGKNKSSTQKIYCDDCADSRRKEQAKLAARLARSSPDYKYPERSLYCSGCKEIKENKNSGYCNACERKRYLLKTKPDCATCGAIKKNPRDAYCGPCKYKAAKARRPFRTYEQIFKDNVRKFTWARINDGTLVRLPCEVCGNVEEVEAHHDDYYRPLDVRWLCKRHHLEHHINERKEES